MTITYQVIVYFGSTTTGAGSFVLDDTTRGLLDSVNYLLGGDTGTDVASDAISIRISRGRQSQLFASFSAGTATVQLNNEDRDYDPLFAASPYAGNLRPGKRVTIIANGVVMFDGRISDWQLAYDHNGRSIANMVCEDSLATLARKQFSDWTATAGQTTGARVTSVLNRSEVGWSGGARDIDTGMSTLQADSIAAGTNVLTYSQLVATSEAGALYASRDGLIAFKDRAALLTAPTAVTFDDTGANVPFQTVAVTSGSDTFYTRVQVQRAGGVAQSYQTASAATDDVVSLSLTGLLLADDSQAYEMATYLANVYATGEARVSQIGTLIDSQILSVTEQQQLLALELTDLVSITWTPNSVGAAINQTAVIDSIDHAIFPGRHDVTLRLGKADSRGPFTLDSATLGVLDGTSLLVF